MTGQRGNFASVLRHRHFRNLWLGQVIAHIGNYFYFLALLISVNQLTGSTLAMSVMTISFSLPQLLFGMVAGVYVDRWDRRWVMLLSDLTRGGLVLLCLLVRGPEQVWIYYLVGFLHGTMGSFFNPARDATIPNLVSPGELLAANALAQTAQTAAMLLGPAAAGFLIEYHGVDIAFIINALTFAVSALAIATIPSQRAPRPEKAQPSKGWAAVWEEMREGLWVSIHNRTVLGLMAMLTVLMLGLGAVNVLWVPYMDRYFGIGPKGLGIIDSIQGVGMLIGSLAVGNLAGRLRKGRMMAGSIAAIGIGILAVGLAPSFTLILIAMFAVGFFIPPAQAAGTTLIQMSVSNARLGRVNAALGTTVTVANLLSMGAAGVAGDVIGIRSVFLFCGIVAMLAALTGLFLIEEPRGHPDGEPETPTIVESPLPTGRATDMGPSPHREDGSQAILWPHPVTRAQQTTDD
ncbi:MAG: MFS transporter [Chloroflexi bacterium]|nr:MFS transporter [Chloroflexota bacterium]